MGLLPFIETITSCARERDHDVLLVTTDEGSSVLTRLGGRSLCDAIVLMDIEAGDGRIPVAASLRVPVILIGVPDDTAGLPCVDVDFALAARMAVDELARLGHRRVAVIGHSPEVVARDINFVRRFQRGVDEAARAHGLQVVVVAPVEPTREGARAAVDQALAHGSEGLGLVVPNSAAIHLVLRALAERGVTPGRDVSVVGMCTDAAAEAMEPAVTNVSLEPRDVSARAMRTLFELLDADGAPPPGAVELVTPRLTRRETTPRP
jgi:DNA-binding LacI/PurR family transcriptional regulator